MKPSKSVEKQIRKKEVAEFDFNMLMQAAVVIIVIAVVVIVGIDIVNDTGKDICEDAGGVFEDNRCFNESSSGASGVNRSSFVADENATYDSIVGLGNITSKLGTLVTAIVGIVIIGIIVRLLGGLGGTGDLGNGIKLQ